MVYSLWAVVAFGIFWPISDNFWFVISTIFDIVLYPVVANCSCCWLYDFKTLLNCFVISSLPPLIIPNACDVYLLNPFSVLLCSFSSASFSASIASNLACFSASRASFASVFLMSAISSSISFNFFLPSIVTAFWYFSRSASSSDSSFFLSALVSASSIALYSASIASFYADNISFCAS